MATLSIQFRYIVWRSMKWLKIRGHVEEQATYYLTVPPPAWMNQYSTQKFIVIGIYRSFLIIIGHHI